MRDLRILLLFTVLLAGCTGSATDLPDDPLMMKATPEPVGDAWRVGDWWDARFFMDLGPGYREEGGGRIVVAATDETGATVLAADRTLATFDFYFDLFFMGRVDADGQPIVEGEPVPLFPRTLAPSTTWSAWFPVPLFGVDRLQPSAVNLSAALFDDERADGRLRITGTTENGFFLDLDYDPEMSWFSYVRLTEQATGRIALSVDLDAHGRDFTGTLHEISGAPIHERLVVTPPCAGPDPSTCDPNLANVPPAMTVNADGHAFAEMAAYLFAFPLTDAGGGAVEFVYTDPEGMPTRLNHASVSERFEGTFYRRPYEKDPSGDWTFHYQLVGTAGAYTALFGLDDHPIEV